jgi:glucose/arabinose dehydrogenase
MVARARFMPAVLTPAAVVVVPLAAVYAWSQPPASPVMDTLPEGPLVFDSSTRGPSGSPIRGPKFRVVPLRGLSRPYAMAFLPDGRMLVTERAGRLRIIRDGVLDPRPVDGMPPVLDRNLKGLNDLALHPRFSENGLVYFTYYKPSPASEGAAWAVLARGRFDGDHALTAVEDVFTTSGLISGPSAARFVFGRDGTIYLAIGVPIPYTGRGGFATVQDAQDPGSHFGKVLRLNDDGTVPPDNPYVTREGYRAEIFARGIRNVMALAVHPETGELWETENGPQGGDELNIIRAGKNYGWPVVSYGRSYSGDLTGATGPVNETPVAAGMEQPMLFWSPSIALSGMAFYTGDRFPDWKGSIFVGALVGTELQRIVMNTRGLTIRRDRLLTELRQRIRDVRQGPDGLLYLLTDEEAGALLRIEPVP